MNNFNARIDALLEKTGVGDILEERGIDINEPMPVEFGTKQNVKMGARQYLMQRFPVSLYAPSLLRFMREENLEAIMSFLEDNVDALSWSKE